MDLSELKGAPKSNGDWATLLIAGTLGYTLDAALNIVGFLEPGVCGPVFATGALGAKKGIEAWTERRRAERLRESGTLAEFDATRKLIDFLKEREVSPGTISELENLLAVAMIRGYSAAELRERVDGILQQYEIPL